jgi:large subunit ribosomal protein L16
LPEQDTPRIFFPPFCAFLFFVLAGINISYKIKFGSFGLKALEPSKLNSKQIESARKVITRYMKRSGKLWIMVFPHTPVTKKPAEVRMGSGKGNVEYYIAKIKPGRIIFEIDGIDPLSAQEALKKASSKLPFKSKIVNYL